MWGKDNGLELQLVWKYIEFGAGLKNGNFFNWGEYTKYFIYRKLKKYFLYTYILLFCSYTYFKEVFLYVVSGKSCTYRGSHLLRQVLRRGLVSCKTTNFPHQCLRSRTKLSKIPRDQFFSLVKIQPLVGF